MAQGEEYDEALQEIYGTNIDGLEQQWRSWLDLPQRQIPPTPTAIVAANVPTVVPLAGPSDVPTPAPEESMPSSTPSPKSGICSLGLVPLFLLGTLFWRKKR
ncbi:MAG: hypothetical protein R3293_10740 [Candidatus Promineifilaceae bacterium]|nr:hypothetical protein [Candidatus Promineifilaceae bacterium]